MTIPVVLVTGGYDHKINFWEPPSEVCTRSLRFSDSQINCLRISNDKQILAAAGNPHVRLFEILSQNPNPVVAFDGHTSNVTDMGFQRENRWMFTGSEDGSIKIWDLRAPTCQRSYDCRAPVNSVAMHPNQGELLSGDQSGKLKLWDLTASKCVEIKIKSDDDPIQSVCISSNAEYAVAGTSHGIVNILKCTQDRRNFAAADNFRAHNKYMLKTIFSPNAGLLVTTGSDNTANVWKVSDWSLDKVLAQHQRWVWDAAFSADSRFLVTASSDHTAKLWALGTGEVIKSYVGHSNMVTCVALHDSNT